MTDEQIERLRKEQVFKVPDGYFENFTQRMMSQIPKEETVIRPQRKSLRRPMWAAASVAVLIAGASALFFFSKDKENAASQVAILSEGNTETISSEELQATADYMMIDSDEIYAYLAENY